MKKRVPELNVPKSPKQPLLTPLTQLTRITKSNAATPLLATRPLCGR